jgi:hypothetical protein
VPGSSVTGIHPVFPIDSVVIEATGMKFSG